MFNLDTSLPAELAPLSWLIGVWEGTGVVHYDDDGTTREHEFGQRVSFSHDGLPYLNYTSSTWLFPADEGDEPTALAAETMRSSFAEDDLVGGLRAGIAMLADHARN